MRALIDTCVIVDYLEDRTGADTAQKLLMLRELTKVITAKTLLDLYYLIHHYTHDRQKTLESLHVIMGMADEIADTTASDVSEALQSQISDYEDAVMAETAYRTGCEFIITRNKKDFRHAKIQIMLPEEFFEDPSL